MYSLINNNISSCPCRITANPQQASTPLIEHQLKPPTTVEQNIPATQEPTKELYTEPSIDTPPSTEPTPGPPTVTEPTGPQPQLGATPNTFIPNGIPKLDLHVAGSAQEERGEIDSSAYLANPHVQGTELNPVEDDIQRQNSITSVESSVTVVAAEPAQRDGNDDAEIVANGIPLVATMRTSTSRVSRAITASQADPSINDYSRAAECCAVSVSQTGHLDTKHHWTEPGVELLLKSKSFHFDQLQGAIDNIHSSEHALTNPPPSPDSPPPPNVPPPVFASRCPPYTSVDVSSTSPPDSNTITQSDSASRESQEDMSYRDMEAVQPTDKLTPYEVPAIPSEEPQTHTNVNLTSPSPPTEPAEHLMDAVAVQDREENKATILKSDTLLPTKNWSEKVRNVKIERSVQEIRCNADPHHHASQSSLAAVSVSQTGHLDTEHHRTEPGVELLLKSKSFHFDQLQGAIDSRPPLETAPTRTSTDSQCSNPPLSVPTNLIHTDHSDSQEPDNERIN